MSEGAQEAHLPGLTATASPPTTALPPPRRPSSIRETASSP